MTDPSEVLEAVLQLLTDQRFQDVHFICSDGQLVHSNRAFLAARCEYFDKLLYGGLSEAGCSNITLQAPSQAFKHILHHMHTGSFSTIEQEDCWDVIMETCALAQQYMLPAVVQHTALRVLFELQAKDLGTALSFALKHDLQAVIRNIWLVGARLLQHPLHFDSTFSAEAICFCLQHTAWLAAPHQHTAGSRLSSACSSMSLDGRDNGSGTSNGKQSASLLNRTAAEHTISSAAGEGTACSAVLDWLQQQVQSCRDCQHTRYLSRATHTTLSNDCADPAHCQKQRQEGRDEASNSDSLSSSRQHQQTPGRQSPFGSIQVLGSKQQAAGGGSQATAIVNGITSGDAINSEWVACGSSVDHNDTGSTSAPGASGDGVGINSKSDGSGVVVDDSSYYSGHCCDHHQALLLQLLARLNWHLLEPAVLDKLEVLELLQPAALLSIYRAHQRCSYQALHGSFACVIDAGHERGLRCYTAGGEQVLDCQSPCHLTTTANISFTHGRHCWQFVVSTPCDLVWLGVGTSELSPDIWGGKQPSGWFYGSNDALCHNRYSDKHAYQQHCGFGKWGAGDVVDVYLDMDQREVWFSVNGAEAKLGFSGLPGRVYPAVSLRAPAELLVRFRAASWIIAQQHEEVS